MQDDDAERERADAAATSVPVATGSVKAMCAEAGTLDQVMSVMPDIARTVDPVDPVEAERFANVATQAADIQRLFRRSMGLTEKSQPIVELRAFMADCP